jgi:hypothetical protein
VRPRCARQGQRPTQIGYSIVSSAERGSATRPESADHDNAIGVAEALLGGTFSEPFALCRRRRAPMRKWRRKRDSSFGPPDSNSASGDFRVRPFRHFTTCERDHLLAKRDGRLPPEARSLPSGLNATDQTTSLCPSRSHSRAARGHRDSNVTRRARFC